MDHPRISVTGTKLTVAQGELDRAEAALESEVRFVRNLAILTPLYKSGRDRIEATLEPLGRRIKLLRLHVARVYCLQDILRGDLAGFQAGLPPIAPNVEYESAREAEGEAPMLSAPITRTRADSSTGSYYSAND